MSDAGIKPKGCTNFKLRPLVRRVSQLYDAEVGKAGLKTTQYSLLSHQVGGFLGAWLGGKAFEATGRFNWVWYIDILLAAGAALVNLPIREARRARRGIGIAAALNPVGTARDAVGFRVQVACGR